MTGYYPLMHRAVAALEGSTGESRLVLYNRAREAQLGQLRKLNPPLSESEITRERLALEEAIRKVETEAARNLRAEPRRNQPSGSGGLQPRPRAQAAPATGPPERGRSAPETAHAHTTEGKSNAARSSVSSPPTRSERAQEVSSPTGPRATSPELSPQAAARARDAARSAQAEVNLRQKALAYQNQAGGHSDGADTDHAGSSHSHDVTKKLIQTFGGRLPTWEEFKRASRGGRVRGNISLALNAMWWRGMPMGYAIFYGFFVASASLLAIPIAVGLYFFAGISGWWIIASIALAAYLFGVTKEGAGMTMINGAERNERLYQMLVVRGAFLFEPSDAAAWADKKVTGAPGSVDVWFFSLPPGQDVHVSAVEYKGALDEYRSVAKKMVGGRRDPSQQP